MKNLKNNVVYVTMLRLFQCYQRLKPVSRPTPISKSRPILKSTPPASFIEKPGHLYIIQEREFIKTKENIYKIGKTTNIKHRMPAYPKDSRLYLCFYCTTNIHVVETYFIDLFDKQFIKRTDIGREYYEGDLSKMILNFTTYMIQQPYNNIIV